MGAVFYHLQSLPLLLRSNSSSHFRVTGIKCKFEFCWECGADHIQIMRHDNSAHKPSCKFHPANLHTRSPYEPLDYYDADDGDQDDDDSEDDDWEDDE